MADEQRDTWIIVPRWGDFQHYKKRNPPWIRAYTRALSNPAYLALTMHQRGVLVSIWLEYARADQELSGNTLALTRQLGQRVSTRDLEALNHAGFIALSASKPPRTPDTEPALRDRDIKTYGAFGGNEATDDDIPF